MTTSLSIFLVDFTTFSKKRFQYYLSVDQSLVFITIFTMTLVILLLYDVIKKTVFCFGNFVCVCVCTHINQQVNRFLLVYLKQWMSQWACQEAKAQKHSIPLPCSVVQRGRGLNGRR